MSDEFPEKVRYRCPPRASRWPKGQSGNPRGGRPGKRRKTTRQIAEDIIRRTVVLDGRTLTYLDVILLRIFDKANRGNKRAKRLLDRIKQYREATPEIWLITPEVQKEMAAAYERRLKESGQVCAPSPIAGMTPREASDAYYRRLNAMRGDEDE